MFKRFIMALVLLPLLVMGLAGVAGASTHIAHVTRTPGIHKLIVPPQHHKRCNETYDHHLYSGIGGVDGAGTKWANNTCIFQQRVHEECLNSQMQTPKENGGWVYSTQIWSNKICGGSNGPWVLVWADIEYRNGPGAPLHYARFYP